MHSAVETPTYLSDAKQAGMDADERAAVVTYVAVNPQAGDMMAGTGGARKFRFKRPGTGKSAGYRVVFYYELQTILAKMVQTYRKGVKV